RPCMRTLPRGGRSLGWGWATLSTRLGPGWVVGGSAATIDGEDTDGRIALSGGGGAATCTAGGPSSTDAASAIKGDVTTGVKTETGDGRPDSTSRIGYPFD